MNRHTAALVWRLGLAESSLALVRRHGEERWSLPGGEPSVDEPWSTAVQRCAVRDLDRPLRPGGFIDASVEPERSRLYFELTLSDGAPDQYETPIGQICFVSPERALALLDDERDRRVIRNHPSPAPLRGTTPTTRQTLRLHALGLNVSFAQLQRQLTLQWAEQRTLEAEALGSAKVEGPRALAIVRAREELSAAEAIACDEPDTGWALLKRARRTQLGAMDAERRRAQWLIIREEAKEKLKKWRGSAAKPALELKGDDLPSAHAMAGVAELLDGYHDGYFDRARLIQKRLALMTLLLFGAITAFELLGPVAQLAGLTTTHTEAQATPKPNASGTEAAGTSSSQQTRMPQTPTSPPAGLLLLAPLIGIIGAICSGLASSVTSNTLKRPQVIVNSMLILARVALGAGSGLGVVLVASTTGATEILLTAMAFAAGFSERLLPAQLDSLFGQDNDNGEKTAKE